MSNSSATISMPISSTSTDHGTKKRSTSDSAVFCTQSTSTAKGRFNIPKFNDCMDLEIGAISQEEFESRKRGQDELVPVSQKAKSAPIVAGARHADSVSKRTKTSHAPIYYDFLDPAKARYLAKYWRCFKMLRDSKFMSRYTVFKRMIARMDENGRVPQTYRPRTYEEGRLFTDDMSLQNCPKVLRNTIMHYSLIDLDFWACHAHLCQQWCAKHGIPTPNLDYYLANRDQCHAHNKHIDLKKAVNSILNGGKGETNDDNAPSWLKCLYTEIQETIQPAMQRYHPDIYQLAVKTKTDEKAEHDKKQLKLPKTRRESFFFNPAGTALSWLMDEIENKCIQALREYGVTNNLWGDDVSLEFDGLKVALNDEPTDEMVSAMQNHIHAKTGYSPIIKIKEPTEFLELPDDLTRPPPMDRLYADDDLQAAMFLLDILGDDFGVCDGVFFIREQGSPVWVMGTTKETIKIVERMLLRRCSTANIWTTKQVKDEMVDEPFSSVHKHAKDIIAFAKAHVPERHDFIDNLHRKMKGQLVYKNGYYDFTKRAFIPNFIGIETAVQIPHDFPERNQDDIDRLYKDVLHPIFENGVDNNGAPKYPHLEGFLHLFSRAMAGHSTDKLSSTIIGPRNSGKTLTLEMLQAAFGDGYTTTILADQLQDNQKKGDANLATGFLLKMEWSRLCLASEMSVDRTKKDPPKIAGQLIKMAQSGGERQTARSLYVDARPVRVNAHLCIAANALPDFTTSDCLERMVPLEFVNAFVEPKVKNANSFNPLYKVKNDDIKAWANHSPEALGAITHVLLEAYQDKPFLFSDYRDLEERRDLLTSDVSEESIFANVIDVTASADDEVTKDEVLKVIKRTGANMSLEQFRKWLEGQIKFIKQVGTVPFKVHYKSGPRGRQVQHFRGLKIIQENESRPAYGGGYQSYIPRYDDELY